MNYRQPMAPRVSVIVPVYNRAHSVGPTLESVRAQTMTDWECIVVDDGSRDGDELRKLVDELADPRFRYVRRPNGGGGAARNTGIDEARGDVVAFLDSDDLWLPEKLAVQSRQLGARTDLVVYCAALVDRGVGKRWIRPSRGIGPGEDVAEYLFVANQFIPTPTIALSRELARAVRWDPGLPRGQDLDYVLMLQEAGCEFTYSPQPLVIWRDMAVEGRTSHRPGLHASEGLLAKHGARMTPKARKGYLVTNHVVHLARERPTKALSALAAGAAAGIPLPVVGRQLLRAFLPPRLYRSVVDRFVAIAGRADHG
jgi:glycosyltransferase involved in cell wall biosynthesis